MAITQYIQAKNRFSGVKRQFTEAIWNRLPALLHKGKLYPKNGYVKIREEELDLATKAAIENATSGVIKPGLENLSVLDDEGLWDHFGGDVEAISQFAESNGITIRGTKKETVLKWLREGITESLKPADSK